MGDLNDPYMRNPNAAVQARAKVQNRANVLQLKLIGQSHPTGLTPNLLKLFEPRPPLEYKPPPEKRKCPPLTGMSQFVKQFAEPGDPEYAPPIPEVETPAQKKARIHQMRLEKGAEKAAEELKKYDPHNDANVTGDPYKTLFVARLNYETTESRIKREFESYGPIKRVRLVTDKSSNKPRGYAFIEYLHTRDMKAAYKQADGRKIDGRRVLVDVERGRTVPNWRPRRLGGGLGTTRVGGEDLNQIRSGREPSHSAPPRSEEPRMRDDRHGERDREKSRERREREKSRERSHDRPRDRDHREDRHHRDRDRHRDREREKDRGRYRDREADRVREKDRERARDHGRERDRDRDRERDHPRKKDRDYVGQDADYSRGRSRDREYEYDDLDAKHEIDYTEKDDDKGWYEEPVHGHRRSDAEHDHEYEHYVHHQDRNHYDDMDVQNDDRYEQMEEDDYHYDRDYRH